LERYLEFIIFDNHKISRLCLGTAQIGMQYGINNSKKLSETTIGNIMNFVINNGINSFDTAICYGDAQEIIGKYSKNSKQYIISKISSDEFLLDLQNLVKKTKNQINSNLFALLLHDTILLNSWNSEHHHIVQKLISNNQIGYFGVSIYSDDEFSLALNNDDIKIIQIPFNLFDNRAVRLKWFQKAKNKNKLLIIRSIYLQGLLLMDENKLPQKLKTAKRYIRILSDMCNALNMSRIELATSFVSYFATNSITIFGCDNKQQAKESIENLTNNKKLNKDIIDKLIECFKNVDENIYNPTKWKS
jgi:aryl-alcohol dehydrogenase-like predicted oxidoreductase